MTVLVAEESQLAGTGDDAVRYGAWPARAGAIALDYLPGVAVISVTALLAYVSPPGNWLRWLFVGAAAIALIATVVNRVVLPPLIGWTLGRAVAGLRVTTADGQPVGGLRLLARELTHVLDTAALLVGWLWPLWDMRNRTFADLASRTEVRAVDPADGPHRNVRRIACGVLVAAAVTCAAAGGLGYLQIYRQDQALEQARAQIAEQGPRIVEQVLSYGSQTVVDDFARAQALATDGYRPVLVAQQQSVQKSGVTDNEYWAVSSAVLSATKDRAAMLLALQGQRGSDPNSLRFITATVRADFEKSDGRWKVAVLTVLKKPLTNQQGQPVQPQQSEPGR